MTNNRPIGHFQTLYLGKLLALGLLTSIVIEGNTTPLLFGCG